MEANPFDALDDDADTILQEAPAPGLSERFRLNFEAGQRHNTVLGAINDAASDSKIKDRQRFDAKFEAFPEWQGFLEGGTALAGQLAGTAASPENFLPIGLGHKILVGSKMAVTGLWAKVFAGAIDGAAANAVADAAIQGVEKGVGHREGFDPVQYGAGILLGAGIGGAGGAVARGLEVRAERRAGAPDPSANPFDALGDVPPATDAADTIVSGRDVQQTPASQNPDAEAAPAPKMQEKPPAPPSASPEPATLGDTLSARAAEVRQIEPTHTGPAGPAYAADAFGDWKAAVTHLVEVKDGEITGMLSHPEIGPIDVVWGSYDPKTGNGAGLAKIVSKHPDMVDSLPDLVRSLPIESRSDNRIVLATPDHRATIRLDYDGEQKTWLLTAYTVSQEKKASRRAKGTTERPDGLQEDTSSSSPATDNIDVKPAGGNEDDALPLLMKQSRAAKADTAGRAVAAEFMAAPVQSGPLRGQLVRQPGGSAGTKVSANIARIRETAEKLAAALDVAATRQGRLPRAKGGKVLGVYKTGSGTVRVKSLDDFDVLTHEYGHHVEKHVPGLTALMRKHGAELKKLDYDPVAGRPEEGFAEFFRLWLTNRAYARAEAPAFATAFEAEMIKHGEIRAAIDDAAQAWAGFLSAPSTVAVASTIVSAKKDGWIAGARAEFRKSGVAGTIHDVLQRIYAFAFDDLNPIARAVKELQEIHLANKGRKLDLKVGEDAYKLARMSRGAYSSGHMDVMYGVAPYRGLNPESPSLRDAIVEATGKPNALSGWDADKVRDFGSYLWSRRALGEWERFDRGEIPNPPDKLTRGDHQQNVADLAAGNPQFVSAADKIHQFSRALWKKKFDAGLIDQTTYEDGLKIVDYVPGLRDFSSDTDQKVPGGRSKGGSARGGFARRFRGSKRDVINPLESLAADAYETAMAIARNDVVKALDRLAMTAGPGAGAIAERIPAKELRASMVDPLEAVETAARNAGLAKPDITLLRDAVESAVGDERAAIFRPAIINDKGEPIVFFRDGGQLTALRLADGKFGKDMYGVLTAMNQNERNFWLEMVAIPARVLRAGITTAFEFIFANFVRDQAMAAIFYGSPLKRVGRSLQGVGDDLLGSETARNYSRVYGLSGGQETASLSKAMAARDISALRSKGWIANRLTSVRGIFQIAEFSETGTRLGLFRTFVDEAKARGLDDMEAALEASWRARDYIDFDRHGSGMAALARVIPFFNASLQGTDKAARHMIAPLVKKVMGIALTPEEQRGLGAAAKSWAYTAALTAASVSLYALQSRHEDHDEVSETTRATHWMIKSGGRWVAVPKPFEFGAIINLAEAAYDAMSRKDPRAGRRWRDSLFDTLMPPSLLEGNPAITSYFEVKTNTNFFTGAPIVPEQLQGLEPFLQYTARTSEISKGLGRAFNVSPAIADHLITAHLGSWGRSALSLYDLAQPDAPGFAWDDAPITRRFIKDAAKGAQSVTMFWKTAGAREGELEGKARSWRTMVESGDPAGAADYYAQQDDIAKVYIGLSSMDAKARRLHPLVRARGAIEAIGAIRRDMAANRLTDGSGNPIDVGSAARTAADDILSTLTMAIARNALGLTGVPGWAQRDEIPEDGFYREIEAVSPDLLQRLADGFATKNVWAYEGVKEAWPELRQRVLAEGSRAPVLDLVGIVQASGAPISGGTKIKRKGKPEMVPGG